MSLTTSQEWEKTDIHYFVCAMQQFRHDRGIQGEKTFPLTSYLLSKQS
jgi:hypothetical protein